MSISLTCTLLIRLMDMFFARLACRWFFRLKLEKDSNIIIICYIIILSRISFKPFDGLETRFKQVKYYHESLFLVVSVNL